MTWYFILGVVTVWALESGGVFESIAHRIKGSGAQQEAARRSTNRPRNHRADRPGTTGTRSGRGNLGSTAGRGCDETAE